MKISEGLKLIGSPAYIPESSRDDLPEFFKEQGYKVGAEIGVFRGEYTEVLAKSGLKIYGIDPWLMYRDYGNSRGQSWMDDQYQTTKARLAPYPNVTLLKETSMQAAERFEEESLDFVYIDGNHQFRYIADDLHEWTLRVKRGGVIAGHDYAYFKTRSPKGGCQVREVVDAYAKSYDLNFWVLGKRDDKIRDHFRSWLFIRK
jgi:hypothetical protein